MWEYFDYSNLQLPFTTVTYYTTLLEGNIWVMQSHLMVYSRTWYFRKYTEVCKAIRLCISELSDLFSSVLWISSSLWQGFAWDSRPTPWIWVVGANHRETVLCSVILKVSLKTGAAVLHPANNQWNWYVLFQFGNKCYNKNCIKAENYLQSMHGKETNNNCTLRGKH
jgi:hypothetical protein